MKQIVIRNLDDPVIHRLKKIGWANGASPDEMARRLLIEAIQSRTAHPCCDLLLARRRGFVPDQQTGSRIWQGRLYFRRGA